MASNLQVDQLRAKLAERGLSTAGTKAILIQRLVGTMEEEKKQSMGSKKRARESNEEQSNESEEIMAIEDFRQMGVKQLREQADLRGLPKTGTKKELLERICKDVEVNGSKDTLQVKEEVDDSSKEKILKATKKGAAVLDLWPPDHLKTQYHVFQQASRVVAMDVFSGLIAGRIVGDDIYDAMLNQTNVGNNNNKFYAIQLLESDGGGQYMVYNRWGRVGVKGQDKLFGPYNSQDVAIREFEQKFFAKTQKHWIDRNKFKSYPKYYTWLEMDYSEKENQELVVSCLCSKAQ
ncbi:hypothetical protein Pint_09088 [Pistacia integerrima]|uniref:Uncharacterized protein n=1 Tax=Pistacia integerrima TaxID=434235 RepID=A0ACC0XW77_9ROSI|nr:hypothetical protein Pint_09088 [Pistacia integerrima]